VTVATNMAGRGTDIILGGNPEAMEVSNEEWVAGNRRVIEQGGLHIIGTERHEARRIDNQLRGRSGRQGDPGSSRFFVAVDDELMRRFGGDKIKSVMDWAGLDEDTPIENKMVGKSVENAQVKVEAYHFDIRKHLVDYDDVVNTHRDVIYKERDKVLNGGDLRDNIRSMADKELTDTLDRYIGDSQPDQWDAEGLIGELQTIFPLSPRLSDPDSLVQVSPEDIEKELLELAKTRYEAQEETLSPEVMRGFERELMLRVIDSHWVQHLTAMENLRQGIGLYAYGQRDPLVMYKKEGHDQFTNLLDRIQYDIVHTVYHVIPAGGQNGTGSTGRGQNGRGRRPSGGKSVMTKIVGRNTEAVSTGSRKVGRNDPCPCGSGKKYKRCCLA
jgi:preprotein translocase subunit SecA